jgi:integrase/recombinase XerD
MAMRIYRRHGNKCKYYNRHGKTFSHKNPASHTKSDSNRAENRCRCKIWYDWHIDGQRTTKPLNTRDWQKALKDVRKIETNGTAEIQTSPIIHDGCERFLKSAFKRQLRESSLYKYRLLIRQFEEFAIKKGIVYFSNLNLDNVREFRESWKNRGQAARKKLENLRRLLGYAQESGWIAENFAKKIEFPIITTPPVVPFFQEDIDKMLAAIPLYPEHLENHVRLKALVLLLWYSGLRIGDAVTLDRGRISKGSIYLRTQKTGTQVFIPLPPLVLKALGDCPGTPYPFWTGDSKRKSCIGDWQRALKKLFKLACIAGGHPHRFRHGFAVRCLLSGLSMEQVAALLGHTDVQITQRVYAQWDVKRQDQLEEAVKKTWVKSRNLKKSHVTKPLQRLEVKK